MRGETVRGVLCMLNRNKRQVEGQTLSVSAPQPDSRRRVWKPFTDWPATSLAQPQTSPKPFVGKRRRRSGYPM